jgi:hypothetical protein
MTLFPRAARCAIVLSLAMPIGAAAAPKAPPRASPVDIATVHLFAACVTDKYRQSVRKLLALDYRTDEYDHALDTLTDASRSCVPFTYGRMTSAGVLLAGAFAEKLLPKMLGGARLADRIAYDPAKPPVAARDEGEYLGLCVARTMPADVAALLATKPTSAEEKAAVAAIAPRLGPCVRAGAAARLNVPGLRAIVALAAYRLATQAGS